MMVGRKSFLTVLAKIPRKVKLQKMMNQAHLKLTQKLRGMYKEAISSLEEVQLFLNNRGYTQESLQLGTFMDSPVNIYK